MSKRPPCPDRGRLESLLAGSLSDAERAPVTEHVEGCESCQKTLDGLAATSREEQARQLADPPAPPEPALARVMSDALGGETLATDARPEGDESLAFLAPPREPGHLGRLGHYEVLELVGQGGFGLVFRAFDEKLHRAVAIKVLAPALAASGTARRRFVREAKAAAAVRNERVVAIYAVEDEHSPPYLVMEYIAGTSLQDRLDRQGALEVKEVLRIGMQTAEGLAAAHQQGLVHRDIKPANILLENGVQRVKITDFGLARAVDDASLSQSGVIAGTPMYMSPEQAQGEALDHRSDLFSLGSVLYAACTGRPPFRASGTMAVLKRVCEAPPRPIREVNPDVPEWLCTLIARLQSKKREDRPESAAEVARLLGEHLAELQQPARKARRRARAAEARTVEQAPARRTSRRRVVALTAVVLLAVLVGVPVAYYLVAGRGGVAATMKGPIDADGWVQLFNGKDLTGWKTHPQQPGGWAVEDGFLTGRSTSGPDLHHLFSERGDYENFHLRVEARVNAGGNSGVYFRSGFGLPLKGTFPGGYEAQIYHNSAVRAPLTGSLYGLADVTESSVAPNEWFTLEVIAEGNVLVIKVNGRITANYVDGKNLSSEGHFALQAIGSGPTVVQFRKIEVKELPPTPGWVALFDGKTTAGWRAYNGKGVPDVWRVTDGALVVRPGTGNDGGDIVTEREYANFELAFEWKVTRGANSGVLYRVSEIQGAPYETGPEYQVLDNKNHGDGLNPTTTAGSAYALYAPSEDATRPVGEWNAARIVANGNHVEHWLNGKKVVEYEIGSSDWNQRVAASKFKTMTLYGKVRKGHIDLQYHGDEVAYRDVKIKVLPPVDDKDIPPPAIQPRATWQGHSAEVYWLALLPDGVTPVSTGYDGTAIVWSPDGKPGRTFGTKGGPKMEQVALRPDADELVTTSWDGKVKFWKRADGSLVRTFDVQQGIMTALGVSPDGKRLAAGGGLLYVEGKVAPGDYDVRLWDLPAGTERAALKGHTDHVTSAEFSPDGKLLATSSHDNTVRIWEVETGREVKVLSGHTGKMQYAAWSPDGTRLASVGWDRTLIVWDTKDWKELRRYPVAGGDLYCVKWSPDGKRLATSGGDKVIRLWDADAARLLATLEGHTHGVRCVAFTRDGKTLYSVGRDGTVRVWDVSPWTAVK